MIHIKLIKNSNGDDNEWFLKDHAFYTDFNDLEDFMNLQKDFMMFLKF